MRVRGVLRGTVAFAAGLAALAALPAGARPDPPVRSY